MGLCHGMSGNAYALLSLYHVTQEDLYKCRAQQFGQFMADHWKELKDVPDAPLSLYEVRLCKLNMLYSGARGMSICRWQELPTQLCMLLLCVFGQFFCDLWRVPRSAARLHVCAISSIYLTTALADLYVRISSAKLTSRTLLAP